MQQRRKKFTNNKKKKKQNRGMGVETRQPSPIVEAAEHQRNSTDMGPKHARKEMSLLHEEGRDEPITCFECQQKVYDVQRCQGCLAARYCGRSCQEAAWRSGHRKACTNLRIAYMSHKASVKLVDMTQEIDGMPLNKFIDYSLATSLFMPESNPWANKILPPGVVGPSIEIFYTNLGRLIRGEWWILGGQWDRDKVTEYVEQRGGASAAKDASEAGINTLLRPAYWHYVFALCIAMSYDFRGAVEMKRFSSETNAANDMFGKHIVENQHNANEPIMEPYRLLQAYGIYAIPPELEEMWRPICKYDAVACFRNSFHKETPH